MRYLLTILFLMVCSVGAERGNSQTPQTSLELTSLPAPEGWAPYPDHSAASPVLHCARYSTRGWVVTPDGENIKIVLSDTQTNHRAPLPPGIKNKNVTGSMGDRRIIQVKDGWLIGLDAGEFGGSLWWFSSDGKRSKKLAEENVVGFAESSRGILVLVGLTHLGMDFGKVLLVSNADGDNRKSEVLADLGSAPITFAVESPDSLLIMTTRGLVRVRTSGMVEKLLPTNYRLLPNSMILFPSGVVYLGMRHFIARLSPSGNSYQEEWFVSGDCLKSGTLDLNCMCASGSQ